MGTIRKILRSWDLYTYTHPLESVLIAIGFVVLAYAVIQ